MKFLQLAFMLIVASCAPAPVTAADGGRWNEQMSQMSPQDAADMYAWFPTVKVPDQPAMSCCGIADAYEADIYRVEDGKTIARVTKGDAKWQTGHEVVIPPNRIVPFRSHGNPTGHGVVFIGSAGQVYCYLPPPGGV